MFSEKNRRGDQKWCPSINFQFHFGIFLFQTFLLLLSSYFCVLNFFSVLYFTLPKVRILTRVFLLTNLDGERCIPVVLDDL